MPLECHLMFSIILRWPFVNFCGSRYSLKRHLRVRTLQFTTARSINDLYDSVDPEVVLSILVHKVNSMESSLKISSLYFCQIRIAHML